MRVPYLRALTLVFTLAIEVLQIAQHPNIGTAVTVDAEATVEKAARSLARHTVGCSLDSLRHFLDDNRLEALRDAGIPENRPIVEGIVILHLALSAAQIPECSLGNLFNESRLPGLNDLTSVKELERVWYDTFTVLPFLEIGSEGLLQPGLRFQVSIDNWPVAKMLLERTFTLYPETARQQGSNINNYLRAILTRCFHLVRDWGWQRCEPILGSMFDFFARNKLAPLAHEESRKPPSFLAYLDQSPSLVIQPNDKAFTIFLKTLAVGLRGLRAVYPDRKIQGITWRYIPNHGRTYRKDENVRQEDIDALRNHHDLLCTLYWASPPGFRPRIKLISSLVDHAASHREACRINVRAWSNLIRYQLSTDGPVANLDSFIEWFKEIIDLSMAQYKLARTEAEGQYDSLKAKNSASVSPQLVEDTIKRNQSQIIATLIDAMAGMKAAIKAAANKESASKLIKDSGIGRVLQLYDPKKQHLTSLLIELMDVYQNYIAFIERRLSSTFSPRRSEESQDYGDWPDSEETQDIDIAQNCAVDPVEVAYEPVHQLLSSCFGSEFSPEDVLLVKVTETWSSVARCSVHCSKKSWDSFIDAYSSSSWSQLRDTSQTRKYKPLFMALLLDNDPCVLRACESSILSSWMISLIERESLLKHQHRLTSALLNADPQHPLLCNLPFLPTYDKYDISAADLRQRRLGLISSILSNMRNAFGDIMRERPQDLRNVRHDNSSLLRSMMSAMKSNYLELQHGQHGHRSETVNGAYVTFVQQVVELFQQYTTDICPVDKFFTDSAAFPLPAADPTYVVGRLRGYGARLSDAGTVKKLAIFSQSVAERAAVDGEQAHL
ncbi:hypothetical protein LTS18_007300, partial [Coniosporium uncinatum]